MHAFHAKHFPSAPLPAQFFCGALETIEAVSYDEDDDGLGYYEDGTKHILTDEQIALFRHTEIQTILRERRRQREVENEAQGPAERLQSQKNTLQSLSDSEEEGLLKSDGSQAGEDAADGSSMNTSSVATPTSTTDGVQDGGVDKDKRYRMLTKEKQRKKNARYKQAQKRKKAEEKKKKKQGGRGDSLAAGNMDGDESDEWDPWHQAKGPDALKAEAVDLEY